MKYEYDVVDNIVDEQLQKEVWDYVTNRTFSACRKNVAYPTPGSIVYYKPADNNKEYMDETYASVNSQYMHRTVFGDNELDIETHPPIAKLWKTINEHYGNQFEINGDQEGVADPNLSQPFWRVYVNAQPEETIKRSHGVHRDTIDMEEGKNYTLLYIANPEWYPTWFGENVFYEDDESSADHQQYQKGFGQSRNFGVGDPYAIIPPKPGRIILYDGRTLHTTRPAAIWAKEMRYAVVFRIRKVA